LKRYKAAVVGLGRIGQEYDYDQHDDSVIATHASSYLYHPGFELLAGVDPIPSRQKRFEAKYGRPAYGDVKTMMDRHHPEVVSIAVPVAEHFPVFEQVIHGKPKAVICEKPIASSSADGRRMQSMADEQHCALLVNYMRRFEPGSIAVKNIIREGGVGEVFKGVVWYSKGLLNNGTHFIDLLCYWLGDVTDVEVIQEGRRWDGNDPEPDLCLHFSKTDVYVLAGREECYSIGEIDLFGSKGRIRYTGSGRNIELQRTVSAPVFQEYTVLKEEREIIPTDLKRYQWHVLEALYGHLAGRAELASDGWTAVKTLEVVELACRGAVKEMQ